jgi:uncharacterized protein (DUF1800 family)
LFVLGIGAYTEADVKAGARALTGWTVDRASARAVFRPRRHDPGPKTILGVTANFDAASYVRLLVDQPAAATFVAGRLWARFGSSQRPRPAAVRGTDTAAVVRALFTDPEFTGTRGDLVKQPVEWAVGAMRQLGIRPARLPDRERRRLVSGLANLGQVPLRPPSVGGWPHGAAWLTTSTLHARIQLADLFATAAPAAVLERLGDTPAADRVDALARLLVVDEWTGRTRAGLAPLTGNPRRLIAAGLSSPEYTVT